ncbi:hypothetical protein AMAG_09545, partial [Allomyces macrogynus ATCC 38327]
FRPSLELPGLTDLAVTLLGGQVMSTLPAMPQLRSLTIMVHRIHAFFAEALGQVCLTLRTLCIESKIVVGSRNDQLQLAFPHLRDLLVPPTIFNLLFPAAGVTSAGGGSQTHAFPSLRKLNVHGLKFARPVAPLAPFPTLSWITTISFVDIGMTNSHILCFATAPCLKSLRLDYCSIVDDGADLGNQTFMSLTDITFVWSDPCPRWLMTARIPRLQRAMFVLGALSDTNYVEVPPMVWPEMEDLGIDAESGRYISLSGAAFDLMPRLQRLRLPDIMVEWIDHVPLLESVLDLTASPSMMDEFPPDALPQLNRLEVRTEWGEEATVPPFSLANIQDLYVTSATLPFLSLMSRLPRLTKLGGSAVGEPDGVLDVEYHDDRRTFWDEFTDIDWETDSMESFLVRVRVVHVADVDFAVQRIGKLAEWVCEANDDIDSEAGGDSDVDAGPRVATFEVLVTARCVEETSFKAQLEHAFMAGIKNARLDVRVVDEEELVAR